MRSARSSYKAILYIDTYLHGTKKELARGKEVEANVRIVLHGEAGRTRGLVCAKGKGFAGKWQSLWERASQRV